MKYPVDWSEEYRRQGICGVLAVAMVGRTSIAGAHKVLAQNLMPHQKRHVRSTYDEQIFASLKALGRTFEVYESERITVRRWVERYARPGVTYMVFTAGHVVTLHNGLLCDQDSIAPMMEHHTKRKFVQKILEVVS